MDFTIRPQPKQREAFKIISKYPYFFYGGAKGGGKSKLIRDWMLARRLKYPKTHGVIIRKSYPELYANHIVKFWEEFPGIKRLYKSTEKQIILPNGSSISFRHLQKKDDVYNFQGTEYHDIALDEATQHSEEVFRVLTSSMRTVDPSIVPHFLLTGNPGGVGMGWVKRLFIKRNFREGEVPEEYGFLQAKVYDNLMLMKADPGYVKRLESLPEDKRRAYLDGDWEVFEGQFFEMWNPRVHVVNKRYDYNILPESFELRVSWDEGVLAPRAVYVMTQDYDSRVEVIWEDYKTGETAETAARRIKHRLTQAGMMPQLQRRGVLVYDPSMDIASNQTGKSTSSIVAGILGMAARPGINDRVEGARRVGQFLSHDELHSAMLTIWSTCTELVRTLPELVHDPNRRGEDIDTDGEDHAYDSMRYGLMSLRLPERMRAQEEVLLPRDAQGKVDVIMPGYSPEGGYF